MPDAKSITYTCEDCGTQHTLPKEKLKIKLPNNLSDTGRSINAYGISSCGKYVEMDFLRTEWDKGTVSSAYNITKKEYDEAIKNLVDTPEEQEENVEELLSYFRPLNKKEAIQYALNEKIIKGKYKTEDFNFNGRTGTFIYNDNSLVFVSSSDQNKESLEKIVLATENLSYQTLEKRQNKNKKIKEKPSNNVQLYFIDSEKNSKDFKKFLDKRKEDYGGKEEVSPLRKIDDNLIVAKKNVISRIKHIPNIVARSIIFGYLPAVGMVYAGYRGIRFIKTLYDLKANGAVINGQMDDVKEDINGRSLEDYTTNKTTLETDLSDAEKLMDSEFNDIKPGSIGNANLDEIDNFMLANGAQLLDSDGDGFTDSYYIPSTGVTTSDPFNDGTIKPENIGQANYDRLSASWEDLQEFEAARISVSNIQGDLDSLINGDGDLPNLQATLDELKGNYDLNDEDISDTSDDIWGAFGVIASLAASIGISIYVNNNKKKTLYGTKLRPLKNDELKSLYNNNLSLDEKKILSPSNYDPKILENLETINTEYKKEIKNEKHNLEEIIKESKIIEKDIEEITSKLLPYSDYVPVYLPLYQYLEKSYNNLGLDIEFDLDDHIKNNTLDILNLDYDHISKTFELDKTEFETHLPHINMWNNLMMKGKKSHAKYLNIQKNKPLIEEKINKLEDSIDDNEQAINIEKIKLKNLSESMFDYLIANPELIYTNNYKNFGGENYSRLKSEIDLNKTDLDSARKALKKLKKKIIN